MNGCLGSLIFYFIGSIPFALFLLLAYTLSSNRKKALYKQFNSFTQRLGAPVLTPSGIFSGLPSFETIFNNHSLRVFVRQTGGKHKTTYSRFEIKVNDQSGFDFLITQQGFLSRIGSFFGMQDVKVGDSAFDEAYVLKTNMHERFVQIFNEDIRRTLIFICPYCREDLDSEKELIVTCKLCHTPHHQSCLSENKQCTTWGCLASETDFA